MTRFVLLVASAALACAQSSQSYVYDGAGNRMPSPSLEVTGNSRTERMQSINGRRVPLEQVEERVVRVEGSTKVVERTIRRFDQTGNPAQLERVLEERITQADGGVSIKASTFRGDLNGNMLPVERSVTEARKSGAGLTSTAVIERPSINGDLGVFEKRSAVEQHSPGRDDRDTVILRRDDNGRFYEAVKETSQRTMQGSQSVENSAQYTTGTSGRLELSNQTVKTATRNGDGSESIVVDVYTPETPGLANALPGGAPKLKEEQVIERRTSNGETSEVVSVRRPSLADPARLGPPRKLRETICRGKCEQ